MAAYLNAFAVGYAAICCFSRCFSFELGLILGALVPGALQRTASQHAALDWAGCRSLRLASASAGAAALAVLGRVVRPGAFAHNRQSYLPPGAVGWPGLRSTADWLAGVGLKWVAPGGAGLRWPQPGTTWVVALVVAAAAATLFVDAYLSRHAFPLLWWHERVYFATLPGLVEELFYRGVLLGLLSRVFPRTVPLPGTHTSWGGLVGVVLFALGHNFKFGSSWLLLGDVVRLFLHGYGWLLLRQLFSSTLPFQLAFGTLFLWVRERTGSVWAAVAAHCLMNGVLAAEHAIS